MFFKFVRIRQLSETRRRDIKAAIVDKAWNAGLLIKAGAQGGYSPFMKF